MAKQFITILLAVLFASCNIEKKAQEENAKSLAAPAQELTVKDFLPLWFEKSIELKSDKYLVQLKKDNDYIYFTYHYTGRKPVYKVQRKELEALNFEQIDVTKIKEQFIAQIVPQADKERVSEVSIGYIGYDYTYSYDPPKQLMKIKAHLIAKELLGNRLDKTYTADYMLASGTLVNAEVYRGKHSKK
ncbi:hypothetical protein ACTHGU_01885 [Chitinophagaceae bacterium MMS25-I14]